MPPMEQSAPVFDVKQLDKLRVLEDEKDPARWERWYHTFLYVYYGHPLTTLSLGQGEAGHGG